MKPSRHRTAAATRQSLLAVALGATASLSLATLPARAAPLVLEGDLAPGGPDHVFLDFDVPPGTAEIEIRHTDGSQANILDFGLMDPTGQRGWGGDTAEPTIVNAAAASRGYRPGAIRPGRWRVIVGKAKIEAPPARYTVEIDLRAAATLPADPTRGTYAPAPPRATGTRFYRGDFHVHSRESTDAKASLEDDAALAARRGLDFIEVSDHNTTTQLDFFGGVEARHPGLLLVPGIEVTTYRGHANAIGATSFVEHKIGQPGATIDASIAAIEAQGALFAVNHPALDLGSLCIGCAWQHEVDPARVSAVEIATGSGATLLSDRALAFWDDLLGKGSHAAAIGGSDDHRAGVVDGPLQSPIGSPTTLVYADALSTSAILRGVKEGRTVVKLTGPEDPMAEIELRSAKDGPPLGIVGTRAAVRSTYVRVTVTGARDQRMRVVKNGVRMEEIDVTGDPFRHDLRVDAPAVGEDRYRVEVLVDGKLRTVTSHVFVSRDPAGPEAVAPTTDDAGCRATPTRAPLSLVVVAVAALLVGAARRLRR